MYNDNWINESGTTLHNQLIFTLIIISENAKFRTGQ